MSEQLLTEILSEIKSIKTDVKSMDARLERMENRQDKMDARLERMENRQEKMDSRRETVEGQLSETNQMVKALLHRSEETDAQLHSLGHALTQVQGRLVKTATKADIDSLAEDINFIMKKVSDHDTEIRKLRRTSFEEKVNNV